MPPRLALPRSLPASLLTTSSPPACSPSSARCASILSSLSDNASAYKKKIRRGRGPASGKGKTAGRGQKGQHAHGKVPARFEGGQTPLRITNPPRGKAKHVPFKVDMSPINLDRIQAWIDAGRLDPRRLITMRELHKSRCLHGVKKHGVKVLARNAEQLTSKINVVVSRASKEAIARIEALGGTITTRFYSPASIKRVLRGDSHPTLSLQASSSLVTLSAQKGSRIASSRILSELAVGKPRVLEKETMTTIIQKVNKQYKYRLPDATSRKDIEYYRDRKHRGYLAHLVTRKETPSLYWRKPRKLAAIKMMKVKSKKAVAKEENRLF